MINKKLAFGKFPIFERKILKNETSHKSAKEIIAFLKSKMAANPVVIVIGEFDHAAHTAKVGQMNPLMKDVQQIIFCFGPAIPNDDIVAVRPRAIGVIEYDEYFIVNFGEAPAPMPNDAMTNWVEQI
jgi:hypothetical protein